MAIAALTRFDSLESSRASESLNDQHVYPLECLQAGHPWHPRSRNSWYRRLPASDCQPGRAPLTAAPGGGAGLLPRHTKSHFSQIIRNNRLENARRHSAGYPGCPGSSGQNDNDLPQKNVFPDASTVSPSRLTPAITERLQVSFGKIIADNAHQINLGREVRCGQGQVR